MKGLVDLIHPVDLHLDPTIVQKDATPGGDLLSQLVVGDSRNGLITANLFGGQSEMVPFAEGDRTLFEASESDLRALKILQNADVDSEFVSHLTDGCNPGGVFGVIAVGKIQSECRGTCLNQFPNAFGTLGGWADRGDDLGSAGQIELGHPWRRKPAESTVMPSTLR